MERIVVGVDGSDESLAALRWAVAEARLRGAEVDAVSAWSYPTLGYSTGLIAPPYFARSDMEAHASQELDRACDAVDADGVRINRLVQEGSAARCLMDTAKDADLLVVGSRGRGGFAGLLLGSVSQHCVHHARCPVVVVR